MRLVSTVAAPHARLCLVAITTVLATRTLEVRFHRRDKIVT
jgi:hypothetical protein